MININGIKEHVDISDNISDDKVHITSSSVKRVTLSSCVISIHVLSNNIPAIEVKSSDKSEEPKISLYLYGKLFSVDMDKTIRSMGHNFFINHVNKIYLFADGTNLRYNRNDILILVRKYKLEQI